MPDTLKKFPLLRTPRLQLVELMPAHAGSLFRLFTDKRVTEYYTVVIINTVADLLPIIDSFKIRFNNRQGIRWGIALRNSSELIGTIGFNSFTTGHKGSIVFALSPEHQGWGYATEAINEVLKFGFEQLSLTRIEAEVMPGNVASAKVLDKTGFTYEGLLRRWLQWNGKDYDLQMYAVLR
jgi:ribosomal-protein-alanine N-acetyltransferase